MTKKTNGHSGASEEANFLVGPRSRWKELKFALKMLSQYIYGFRKLHFIGPCVTVFGSARFKENHFAYQMGREVGSELAKMGFTVMTGGGPGIMEAANRGAKEVNGYSVGCNINLPWEQDPNPFLDIWVDFDFFFVRKVMLRKYSAAFVVMPGGYGTLDEFFEAITLIQTRKLNQFPVVVMGLEFHKELIEHIHKMEEMETISKEDLDLILFTDSVEEAITHIRIKAVEGFGLQMKARYKPKWWLGEKKVKKVPGND